jgi:rRNA-processing protein FCF1
MPDVYCLEGRAVDIYLDTNLWNELCDQAVDPEDLMGSLGSRDTRLVLGTHCINEMAKTFRASKSRAASRARELFLCLKKFVEFNIPCVKETMELLAVEMLALKWQVSTINPILSSDDHGKVKREVAKLANGTFDERADTFIAGRIASAETARRNQAQHLDRRPDVREKLKTVLPENLERWLETETMTTTGAALLAEHIQRQFPEAPPGEVSSSAPALLALPSYRVARGLVRADLYSNWRCAHRNSNPRDLVDDMYHVLNASYCDVYATKEDKQSKYARFLLTSRTKVAIYDGQTGVGRWLEMLA